MRVRVALVMVCLARLVGAASAQTISLNGIQPPTGLTLAAAAPVLVDIAGGPGNAGDWIGLYPTGASDSAYVSWSYLSGTSTPPATGLADASLVRTAPVAAGTYEWRLYANSSFTRVATSGPLTVTASASAVVVNGAVAPASTTAVAGSTLVVTVTLGPGNPTDWVALAAAGAPDSDALDWRYLNDTTVAPSSGLTGGTLTFLAPAAPGAYEVRFFAVNSYGRLATSGPVHVTASPAALVVNGTAPPTAVPVAAGTYVTVDVTAGPGHPGDWVGLFAANAADSAFLSWRYLNGATTLPVSGFTDATLSFGVPVTPGSYELRFFNANSYVRLATSTSLVVSAAMAQVAVNGVASPTSTTAAPGTQAIVSVAAGPGNAGDWVGLYAAGAADSEVLDWRYLNDTGTAPATGLTTGTLHVGVPTTAGTYEFRFFMDYTFGRLATSGPLVVPQTPAQIAVNGTAPPTSVTVAPGSTITATITGGPGNPTDWVALAVQGAPNSAYVSWQYLNGSTIPPSNGLTSGTVSVTLPSGPATYELRLFASNSPQRVVSSAPIVASTAPPVVTLALTSPFPGTTFNAPASLVVAADATISGGTIQHVDFYDGAALIGTATASPYAVTWTAPAEGLHTLTAVAVDALNGPTASNPATISIGPAGAMLGTLATPLATPGAGVFAPGVMVSLTAAPGTEVRYTRNGGTPTPTSTLFLSPLTVSSTETIRARAFRAGWTESAEMVAAYQVDTTSPTIVATVSPAPNDGGWHRSPVTVSFTCDDAQPVAVCPAPIVVNSEGTNLLVSGTATDAVGNQASTSVILDIDLTAPTVGITSPTSNDIFTPGPAAITATAFDGLSDIQSATCNGVVAVVANGALECLVSVPPGPTTVVVYVSDAAGNGTSRSLTLNSNSPRTALLISPKRRTLLVGDTHDIRVVDQLGRLVGDATLSTTDPSIATVNFVEIGEPAVLQAVSSGTATITATAGTLSAELEVTVVAGATLPAGTPVWTFNTPDQANGAAPLVARDSTEAELLVFTSQWFGANVLMHGLNAAGEVVHTEVGPLPWSVPTVGDTGRAPASDTLGGYLSVSGTPRHPSGFVVRRNAFSGQGLSWEYHSAPNTSPMFEVLRHSQAPDGTLYLVEESPGVDSNLDVYRKAFVVVLDGASGQVRSRVALPASSGCFSDLTTGVRRPVPILPYYTLTPVVGRDGAAYMVVATQYETCGSGMGESRVWSVGAAIDLVRIAPSGSDTVIRVRGYEQLMCHSCPHPLRGFGTRSELTPDGTGAVLFKGVDTYFETALQQNIETEFVYRHGPTSSGEVTHALGVAPVVLVGKTLMYSSSFGALSAHEPSNGATQWTIGIGESEKPLSALADGGVVLYDQSTGQMSQVDGTGTRQPAEQLPLAGGVIQTGVGEVVGSTFTPDWTTYVGVAKVVTSDTTDYTVYPTQTGGNADQRRGRFGIYVKGHTAVHEFGIDIGPYRHASLRVVPRDQPYWRDILLGYPNGNTLDRYGNAFVTFGAGAEGGDTTLACLLRLPGGVLTADRNRISDRIRKADDLKLVLDNDQATEFELLNQLNDRAGFYASNSNTGPGALTYECFPDDAQDDGEDGYNSNSYVAGLLQSAHLPLPVFGGWRYPGWNRAVPGLHFGVVP